MSQDMAPLYGQLVITSPNENRSGIPNEVDAMQDHNRLITEEHNRLMTEEHVFLMIQDAAYHLAEKRGFAPGHELEDWLQAEAQILK